MSSETNGNGNGNKCVICLEEKNLSTITSLVEDCVCVKDYIIPDLVGCNCNFHIHPECYYKYTQQCGFKCLFCKNTLILKFQGSHTDYNCVCDDNYDTDCDDNCDPDDNLDRLDRLDALEQGHIIVSINNNNNTQTFVLDERYGNIINNIALAAISGRGNYNTDMMGQGRYESGYEADTETDGDGDGDSGTNINNTNNAITIPPDNCAMLTRLICAFMNIIILIIIFIMLSILAYLHYN